MVAIIEGGVRFPLYPHLVEFFNYFNLAPTQVSPNIFRIVMGVVELNSQLGLLLTVMLRPCDAIVRKTSLIR